MIFTSWSTVVTWEVNWRQTTNVFEMLLRLLNGWHELERIVAEDMSVAFSKAAVAGVFLQRPNALKIGKVEACGPVTFLPTVSIVVRSFFWSLTELIQGAYERIIAGNYKGTRDFEGVQRIPLMDEYAQAVAEGLVKSFSKTDSALTLPENRQPSF